MKRSQKNKGSIKAGGSWRFFVIMVVVLVITAGASFFYFKPRFSFESSFISDITSRNRDISEETDIADSADLYKGSSSASPDEGVREDSVLVIAEDVIREYIKPYNIRLLDLYMDSMGVVYIDLSDELHNNFKGDVLEELNIIAGLYSRIKETVPVFTNLKMLIEGKEADSFAGHIDISKPIGEDIAITIK